MKKYRKKPKIEFSTGHLHSYLWHLCDSGELLFHLEISLGTSRHSRASSSVLRFSLRARLPYFFSYGVPTTISHQEGMRNVPRSENPSSSIPSSHPSSFSLPIASSRILSTSSSNIMKKYLLLILLVSLSSGMMMDCIFA